MCKETERYKKLAKKVIKVGFIRLGRSDREWFLGLEHKHVPKCAGCGLVKSEYKSIIARSHQKE